MMRAEKLPILMLILFLGLTIQATAYAQQPLLQITSPVEGAVVAPGQSITVTLAADPSVQDIGVFGDAPLSFGQSTPSPLQFTISVASNATPGVYPIGAMGLASGIDVHADPIPVDVERPDAPQFVTVELDFLQFSGVGEQTSIISYGVFNDGNKINISRSTKTTYLSNDPTVATVSNSGLVTAVAPGKTTIAVNTTDCTAPPFLVDVEVPYPQPIGTSLSPTTGPVGTVVTLEGTNFGPTQGSSTVTFFGIAAVPTTWNDTSIVVPTPSSLPAGNAGVVITVNGVAGEGGTFALTPEITGFESDQGAPTVGAPLIILGTSFGATQGSSTVVIGGITAAPTSWSDTSVAINVPSGLPVGYFDVTVTVNGMTSNARTFYLVPGINSISPTFGPVGTSVTISGTSFGATQGSSTIDFCGGQPTSWSDTAIVVPVVDSTGSCTPTVTVYTSGGPNNSWGSNSSLYFDLSPPAIRSLSPTYGQVGSMLNISGSNFGIGSGTVTINGLPATVESWTPSGVSVFVPSSATSGNVVVTSAHGVSSNGLPFTVISRRSFSLNPNASTTPGLLQLAGPQFGTTTFVAPDLINQPAGEYLIEAFDTQAGVPNSSNTWLGGIPAYIHVTLQQVAGTAGSLFPEVKLFLNGPSGTPICSAIFPTALSATQTGYDLSCSPSSDITLTPTDRYYLWVGVNSTAVSSASLQFELFLGVAQRGFGDYGSVSVPVQ